MIFFPFGRIDVNLILVFIANGLASHFKYFIDDIFFMINNLCYWTFVIALCTLYNSCVKSPLTYASSAWSSYYEVHSGVIEGVQRRFFRLLFYTIGARE